MKCSKAARVRKIPLRLKGKIYIPVIRPAMLIALMFMRGLQ